jgi:hypothetical protein
MGGYQGGGYQGGGYDQPSHGGFGEQQRSGATPESQWQAQGCPVPGPNDWIMYRAKDSGEVYYHNHRTGATTWDKPPEWVG